MGETAPLCFAFIGSYGNLVRYGVMAGDCEAWIVLPTAVGVFVKKG